MSDMSLLSEHQMKKTERFFPLAHGVPCVDDQRILSGIIYVIRNGLQWKDAPKAYCLYQTLYNCFIRWSCLSIFDRIFAVLTEQAVRSKRLMIDVTHLKAYRTSTPLFKKGGFSPPYRANQRRPLRLHLTAGLVSNFKGADVLLADLRDETEEVIGDRGYGSDQIRLSLAECTITAFIPPKKNRESKPSYDWHL